jgi:hypothetical protein
MHTGNSPSLDIFLVAHDNLHCIRWWDCQWMCQYTFLDIIIRITLWILSKWTSRLPFPDEGCWYVFIVDAIFIFYVNVCISLGFSAHCLSCVSCYSVLNHVTCLVGTVGNTKFFRLGFSSLCVWFLFICRTYEVLLLYLVPCYFETKLQGCYIVSYVRLYPSYSSLQKNVLVFIVASNIVSVGFVLCISKYLQNCPKIILTSIMISVAFLYTYPY